jgi:hypothetical protein
LSSGLAVFFLSLLAVQLPVSRAGEYSIAGALPGDQDFPAASISADGGYLVWEDNRIDGGKYGSGIAAAGLSSSLAATGSVFRVNQHPAGNQKQPQILRLRNGGTLIAWEQRQSGKPGVYARVLDPNGRFASGDLLVSTPTWSSSVKQSNSWYVLSKNTWKLRKYKFREKIQNIREQAGGVALAALPDGGAVVAYHAIRRAETNSYRVVTNDFLTKTRYGKVVYADDWMHEVFCQKLDADGRKIGPEVMVNQSVRFNQRNPSVATLTDGRFIVVWVSEFPVSEAWGVSSRVGARLRADARQNFRVAVFGRLFNAGGEPVGDELSLAAGDEFIQANPFVAAQPGGGFTVFCSRQEGTDSRRWDVYGQHFGSDGMASGPAFRVNEFTTGDQFAPRVAAQGDSQLVVWTSVGQDGSREGVYGRWLTAGALSGEEFRVNTSTASRQLHPAVAADGAGRFLGLWAGFTAETGLDLFAQSYSLPGSGVGVVGAFEAITARNYLNGVLLDGQRIPPLPPTPLTPPDAPRTPPLPQ